MSVYFDKKFIDLSFSSDFELADYEECTFINCKFSQTNLAKVQFLNCFFNDCIFQSVNLSLTSFKEVTFSNCQFFGMQFEHANSFLFEICLENSHLKTCSFYGVNLKNSKFSNSQFINTDFTNANLTNLNFNNCNLEKSIFEGAILEKTNFSTAQNFSIDLSKNLVKKTIFAHDNLKGLLDNFEIEIC